MPKWSHSKLSLILTCSMSYYLQYIQGILPKESKKALSLGSAVHWGLEHSTEDLMQYFIENDNYMSGTPYTRDQMLAEAMVHGYLEMKDSIIDRMLTDESTGEKAVIQREEHEIYLTAKLKSHKFDEPNNFLGIIDWLILTNKGFIIVDYKTSTYTPNWDEYLDQIYRYIILVNSVFPGVPIFKIAIINLRKSKVAQNRTESDKSYALRLKKEYEIDDNEYIELHTYEPEKLDKKVIDDYLYTLERDVDKAALIDLNNIWHINWSATQNKYGKSQYYDIFYKTENAFVLYTIADKIYNQRTKQFDTRRDCRPLDMLVIERDDVLNKYEQFKVQATAFYSMNSDINKADFFESLNRRFITDETLLERYWVTLEHELEVQAQSSK